MSQLTALRHDLAALQREAGLTELQTDEYTSDLLHQVVAIEELLFAPWWRRPAVRRRWRRDVAASIRHIDGQDFIERRLNTIGTGWLSTARVQWNPPPLPGEE